MRRTITTMSCLLPLMLAIAPAEAQSVTVTDPVGDFLPSYTGPQLADLDVTSFSVNYNAQSSIFTLGATFAGAIDPSTAGSYVFGVNTGTGLLHPFASIGEGNVLFNQAITINKNGTGTAGATAITINGNSLTFQIAASLLPSTGFAPEQYGFNLWPKSGAGNALITDFSPENATLAVAALPEPASWALMIVGFAAVGGAMRVRRRSFGMAMA